MIRRTDKNKCTPVQEWPRIDAEAWAAALASPDPLDTSVGFAHRWAPSTRSTIENGYGRWLHWLTRGDRLVPGSAPADRVDRQTVSAYLQELRDQGLADYTVSGRLRQLANALQAIAPTEDWSWVQRAAERIHSNATPKKDLTARMQPTEQLVQLGCDMMQAAENDRFRTDCDRATLFRDGLLLAFLTLRPLRLANFSGLTLETHLNRNGGTWSVLIPAAETKGRELIAFEWPSELAEPLDRYLAVHRPTLLKGDTKSSGDAGSLWISRQGRAMTPDAIAVQVGTRTKEEFGVAINPHTFRHIAATAIATAVPGEATGIRNVLGHSSMRASEKYYDRSQLLGAGIHYSAALNDIRSRARSNYDRQPTSPLQADCLTRNPQPDR